MGAGAVWMLSLQELAARGGHRGPVVTAGRSPYGPIRPQKDEATGLELLKLPEGFRYWSYSWTGDVMSDGVRCPNLHDGMAVVDDWQPADATGRINGDDRDHDGARPSGKVVLVRNHEGSAGSTRAAQSGSRPGPASPAPSATAPAASRHGARG
jgi:hypothetical protein